MSQQSPLSIERWDSIEPPKKRWWPGALKVGGVAALGAVALVLIAGTLRHSDSRTYALSGPVERMVVSVDAGRVDIVGVASKTDARVTRARRSTLGSPSATTQRLSGGVLRVIGLCPGGLVLSCRTDFRIEAPAGAIVEVTTATADVTVEGMTASVEVNSQDGSLTLRRLGGRTLVAKTVTGSVAAVDVAATQVDVGAWRRVTLVLRNVGDSVSVETRKGPVDVTIPDAPYKVRTDSAIGIVKVDVTQSPGSRRSIDVSAPEGDIRVHPPA